MKNNLSEILYWLKISQSELAEKADISRGSVSAICQQRDSANPSYKTMVAISEALGVSVNDIFFNESLNYSKLMKSRNDPSKK